MSLADDVIKRAPGVVAEDEGWPHRVAQDPQELVYVLVTQIVHLIKKYKY